MYFYLFKSQNYFCRHSYIGTACLFFIERLFLLETFPFEQYFFSLTFCISLTHSLSYMHCTVCTLSVCLSPSLPFIFRATFLPLRAEQRSLSHSPSFSHTQSFLSYIQEPYILYLSTTFISSVNI